jgi:hypothetical protein
MFAGMKMIVRICACVLLLGSASFSVPKPHSVGFGRWTSIKLIEEGEEKQIDISVRPLLVDGRTREFIVGQPHDVTERTFVVQRVYRLNDSLAQETGRFIGFGNAVDGCWLIGVPVGCRQFCCRR